jgi:phenylacetate-coenzyme A ligase PaaK-like adenylate-forming protein
MQYAAPEHLAELQFARVRETLEWAYERSPFYRRLYDAHGVHPRDVRTPADFAARVPVVEREQLAAASDLFTGVPGSVPTMTSGTSGTPFVFPIDRRALAMEQAAIFHQWSRAGFRPGDTRVELRGYQVEPVSRISDAGVVRLSVVNMERHLEEMVALLNRERIPFLHGYPSALAKFAVLLRDRGLSLHYPVRGVFLASENVFSWQVELVEGVIRPAMVLAHYGLAERVVLGAWCEHERSYHFLPLYGLLEQGPSGEVVGTGFLNRAAPFIRYRTSDVLLERSDAPCPRCGRGWAPLVTGVGGRMEDYLVDERGELIPPAVVTFPFKNLRFIKSVQIVQRADRTVVLRCVSAPGPDDEVRAERERLRSGFVDMLGRGVPVGFEDVAEIPLTDACKFKWIISDAKGALP